MCRDGGILVRCQTLDTVEFFFTADHGCYLDGASKKTNIAGPECEPDDILGAGTKAWVSRLSFSDDLLKVLHSNVSGWLGLRLAPSEVRPVRSIKDKPLPREFGWVTSNGQDRTADRFANAHSFGGGRA